ncbi:MAG: hypothetical protein KAT56_04185 [Sedimentisphaerales bacterium]|nr:hypothetical protein [Sedimentisphaerales bacterium]
MLDVPLIIQKDDRSCGQHCVAMIGRYFGLKNLDPFDQRITQFQRKDRVLDSFGIVLSFLELFDNDYVFYATRSLNQLVDVNGEIVDPPQDMEERRKRILQSNRVIVFEYAEETEGKIASNLLKFTINEAKTPCVVPLYYGEINKNCNMLHNLVVTGYAPETVHVNNSGPEPNAGKNQAHNLECFNKGWSVADYDIIVPVCNMGN